MRLRLHGFFDPSSMSRLHLVRDWMRPGELLLSVSWGNPHTDAVWGLDVVVTTRKMRS